MMKFKAIATLLLATSLAVPVQSMQEFEWLPSFEQIEEAKLLLSEVLEGNTEDFNIKDFSETMDLSEKNAFVLYNTVMLQQSILSQNLQINENRQNNDSLLEQWFSLFGKAEVYSSAAQTIRYLWSYRDVVFFDRERCASEIIYGLKHINEEVESLEIDIPNSIGEQLYDQFFNDNGRSLQICAAINEAYQNKHLRNAIITEAQLIDFLRTCEIVGQEATELAEKFFGKILSKQKELKEGHEEGIKIDLNPQPKWKPEEELEFLAGRWIQDYAKNTPKNLQTVEGGINYIVDQKYMIKQPNETLAPLTLEQATILYGRIVYGDED